MTSDKIIRIGIIGAGFARSTQIPGFKACAGARIVAIASARREHAQEVAREFGIDNVENDWRALVARDDIDLVSIVTPVVTHCEMTLAALDRGKAVLCEKPMAMNAAEALRMTERAQEKGVLALIDHELRFLPGRLRMRELVRRGEIGKARHAKLTFRSDSRAVSEVLGNLATHIRERKDESGTVRQVTTDDEANLLLRFEDGEFTESATGNASMSLVESGQPAHRLELFGSLGGLRIEEGGELWQSKIGDGEWRRVETDPGELAPDMRDGGWARGFTAFAKRIVDALREGCTMVEGAATFADGYRTQLVLDAARRANESGCWAKIE